MPDIPTELCLVWLTPVWQEGSEPSSSVSEPLSSWVEALLISLYPSVLLPTLSCRLFSIAVFIFLLALWMHTSRGEVSLQSLCFLQKMNTFWSHIQKDLHSPNQPYSPSLCLPRPCYFSCVLVTSLFQMLPFPCTVDEYFPIHATAMWSDTVQAEWLQQAVFS